MNMLTKLGTVAAISLLALQPAIAQEAAPAPDAAAPMAAAPAGNLDALTAALSAGASTDLSTVTDASTVNVVTVSSVSAGADLTALDAALGANAEALTTLRTNVAANTALATKLTDAGVTADKVVAVVTEADGSVTVYVDDRA